jgi:uncharacterized protein
VVPTAFRVEGPTAFREEGPLLTLIGRGLGGRRAVIAVGIGLSAVAADLWLVWLKSDEETLHGRWAVALTVMSAYTWLSDGDLPTVGLCHPSGGWRSWVRKGIVLGVGALVCFGVTAIVWVVAGWALPIRSVGPPVFGRAFLHMCLFAPLLEEAIYRVALCVPLAAACGAWCGVVVSGALFGLLHVVYGNPSPENILGGFFLAWAYLRSGSVCVPILLHSAGNLLALVSQMFAWYWAV